jgi:hypothetical protein
LLDDEEEILVNEETKETNEELTNSFLKEDTLQRKSEKMDVVNQKMLEEFGDNLMERMLQHQLQQQKDMEERIVNQVIMFQTRKQSSHKKNKVLDESSSAYKKSNYVEQDESEGEEHGNEMSSPILKTPRRSEYRVRDDREFKSPKRFGMSDDEEDESTRSFDKEELYIASPIKDKKELKVRKAVQGQESMMDRMSISHVGNHEGVMRLQSDKFQEITWKEKTVDGYLRFLDEVDQFRLKNNQDVPYLLPLVEEKLREVIMSEIYTYYSNIFPTRQKMFQITAAYLTKIV